MISKYLTLWEKRPSKYSSRSDSSSSSNGGDDGGRSSNGGDDGGRSRNGSSGSKSIVSGGILYQPLLKIRWFWLQLFVFLRKKMKEPWGLDPPPLETKVEMCTKEKNTQQWKRKHPSQQTDCPCVSALLLNLILPNGAVLLNHLFLSFMRSAIRVCS